MGTTATAASQGGDLAPAAGGWGGAGGGTGRGAVVGWVMVASTRSLFALVVTRLEGPHLPGGLLGPLGVALAVRDGHGHAQSGPQSRPALVLVDPDADG